MEESIAEKYIETRFPDATESYKKEWRHRFDCNIEWQSSDPEGRRLLQQLVPNKYPVVRYRKDSNRYGDIGKCRFESCQGR